jgi:hypothetical protein
VVLERRVASEPRRSPARVLPETGGVTPWLWHELGARSLVVHCIDARRAKAQLALRRAAPHRNLVRPVAKRAGSYMRGQPDAGLVIGEDRPG